MNCDTFRANYRSTVGKSIAMDDAQIKAADDHLKECRACDDWHYAELVRARGADPAKFACVHVAYRVTYKCEQHDDPWECPDYVLVYSGQFDEYGIPIRDGGPSKIAIDFCPWCGIELPKSKRDLWFDTLASLGYDHPWSQQIPDEFKSDAWWRLEKK